MTETRRVDVERVIGILVLIGAAAYLALLAWRKISSSKKICVPDGPKALYSILYYRLKD